MKSAPEGSYGRSGAAIVVDPRLCNGCRACELACSLHHSGLMSPELSSVKVRRSNRTAAIEWLALSTCDLCETEEEPLCQKYCGCKAIRIGAAT
jgi:Fe-S-cluster-containing dehydrogenase component